MQVLNHYPSYRAFPYDSLATCLLGSRIVVDSTLSPYSLPKSISVCRRASTNYQKDGWTPHLQKRNICPNPFSVSQWKNEPSRVLDMGANEIGLKMKFQPFSTLQNKLRANNKSPLLADFDHIKDTQSAKKSIAMRILYQATQLKRNEVSDEQQSFKDWIDEVNAKGLPHVTEITDAIALLGGNPDAQCVIAIDDVHALVKDSGRVVSQDAMTHLISALHETMVNSPRLNFIMARNREYETVILDANRSDCHIKPIYLRGLDYSNQSAILDNYPEMSGWRLSQGTKQLLLEMGGLPKLLEAFIRIIVPELKLVGSFDRLNFPAIQRAFTQDEVMLRYPWSGDTATVARRLVQVIVLRLPVEPGDRVGPEGQDLTYEGLEKYSLITLEPTEQGGKTFRVTMALLSFRRVLSKAISGSKDMEDILRLRKVECLLEGYNPRSDQGFEEFAALYTTVLNDFFRQEQSEKKVPLSLSQRYVEGYGGAGSIKITELLAKSPEMLMCTRRFPGSYPPTSRKHISGRKGRTIPIWEGDVWLNAKGAEFADVFYACQANDDDKVIGEQLKHGLGILSFDACLIEHLKNQSSWERFQRSSRGLVKIAQDRARVVTVVISTKEVKAPYDHQNHQDLLVIDRTKLRQYFGIFEPLLAHHRYISINTMDETQLKHYFNESLAKGIVDIRDKGFTCEEDYRRRMGLAGHTKVDPRGLLGDCVY